MKKKKCKKEFVLATWFPRVMSNPYREVNLISDVRKSGDLVLNFPNQYWWADSPKVELVLRVIDEKEKA